MNNLIRISGVILLILLIFLIHSCEVDKPGTPIITTAIVTEITQTTSISGGDVTNEGVSPVVSRGICWDISANPTIANSKIVESGGSGAFTCRLTQLTPNSLYYVRAYASNSVGTGYGNQVSFTTSQIAAPVLTTTPITSINETTAVSGGNITDDKGGSITARGVCWSTITNPTLVDSKTTDGTGTEIFTSSLTSLIGNTTYYVRAYATNSAGTEYGNQVSFTTITIPTVSTTLVATFTYNSAIVGGIVSSDGNATVIERGVHWGLSENPETTGTKFQIGDGVGTFSTTLTSLNPNTTYYVKAYATNNAGTGYGNTMSFTTKLNEIIFNPSLTYGIVTDIDGNEYKTITIGTQTWMAENLRSTKYNSGDLIGTTTPSTLDIRSESSPKYQWAYDGDESNVANYGRLYTWYVATDSRNVCPTAWHLPTDAEWSTLTTFLGGEWQAGGSMKETSTAHWKSPNTGATNETGFTALPGGFRDGDGDFVDIGGYGHWWSSTIGDNNHPWERCLLYVQPEVNRARFNKEGGFSVRCVRDY